MRHNQPCNVCCSAMQLDKWKVSHMTCILKGSMMYVYACVCVLVCACVALTPTPPHGNITIICCDKIPVGNNICHSTDMAMWYCYYYSIIIMFFIHYHRSYRRVCGCPAWGGWVGWCRTKAHVFLNGLTAALPGWPFYCEYAASRHRYSL